ncbi:MAG: T9SS type A sorting domain-containing protein [Bacteroidia bacterium]|nr:T9SS type A sorting domain-containing protein [Bacteroidia bacterium]MDW8159049.1 T9SS type A sorting domain-containing protein [Bacteroidia bacterium]
MLFAQGLSFSILQQKSLGGESSDICTSLLSLPSGSFLLGGYSWSNGKKGDKVDTLRSFLLPDIWLLELDVQKNIIWQKTYGGTGADILKKIVRLQDGNILLGASSNSIKSFEKSENTRGLYDYWLLKITPSGSVIWDKTLGGSRNDFLVAVLELDNGEILVGGNSFSTKSGDKNSENWGEADIWLCKLRASGELIWQRSLGGNNIEQLAALQKKKNGNFLILGTTYSDSSGSIVDTSRGGADLWIAEVSQAGNIVRQKRIGGNKNDIAAALWINEKEEIFLLAASHSDSSFQKTEPCRGDFDYWFLVLDSRLEIVGQKTLGGIQPDFPVAFCNVAPEDTLLSIVGYSYSNIGYEKQQPARGQEDIWLLTLDKKGRVLEEQTVGGNASDRPAGCYYMPKQNLYVAAYSNSTQGFEKEDSSKGLEDYWFLAIQSATLGKTENPFGAEEFIKVYPNPTHSNLCIQAVPLENAYLTIWDVWGNKLWQQSLSSEESIELNLSLPPGLYLLHFHSPKGKLVKKIIVY